MGIIYKDGPGVRLYAVVDRVSRSSRLVSQVDRWNCQQLVSIAFFSLGWQ